MPVEHDKSDRNELKTYFVRNAIPTEGNFAALIDASINQSDDGVAKPADQALSIEATGNQAEVIDLYRSFNDARPEWSIKMSPRPDPRRTTTTAGFAVSDNKGLPRLFLDASTGALGVGTTVAPDTLTVEGGARILTDTNPIRFTSKWSAFPDRVTNQAEICNDTNTYKTLMIVGNKSGTGNARRVSVWDRLEVNGTLRVTAGIEQDAWTAARFAHSWVNYGNGYAGASYMKDSMGFVHLRGLVKSGKVGGSFWIFTLPGPYRPTGRLIFNQQTQPNASCRVDVTKDGKVIPMNGKPGWMSLDGISFRAG